MENAIALGLVTLRRNADLSLFSKPIEEKPVHAESIERGIESLLSDMRKQIANDETVGGTVSLSGQDMPTSGYMVGGYVDSLIFDSALLTHGTVAEQMIARFVGSHLTFATKHSTFLGGWLDTADGQIYIDLSQRFETVVEARLQAEFNDEIAIWDLLNSEEIRVK